MANVQEALEGARDIIAENISDEADYRSWIRKQTMQKGHIISSAKDEKAESVYENYYEFDEPVNRLAGYRTLALNRGEKEKFLTVKIEAPQEDILRYLEKKIIHGENLSTTQILKEAIEDSYKRLIAPAIEREIRGELTEKAEDGAIEVFGKKFRTASHAASNRGTHSSWLGSGIPYRLQTGCRRPNRKSCRHYRHLPYSTDDTTENPGCKRHVKKTHCKI